MPMSHRGYAFGRYVIDAVRRLVWLDGKALQVTGKAFEILLFLVEHRDRVVEKDELLKAIWPDTFVQENNLVRHVSTLRRALGQKPDQHDCILTVQGRGYQFVAAVTELDVIPAGLPTESATTLAPPAVSNGDVAPPGVETSAIPPRQSARPSWLGVAAIAIVALGASAATALLIVNRRTHVAASS